MSLIRAILTYRNPQPRQLISLSNAIFKDVTEHSLYVASPETELILYSSDRVESLRILRDLTVYPPTPALLKQIQKDLDIMSSCLK